MHKTITGEKYNAARVLIKIIIKSGGETQKQSSYA